MARQHAKPHVTESCERQFDEPLLSQPADCRHDYGTHGKMTVGTPDGAKYKDLSVGFDAGDPDTSDNHPFSPGDWLFGGRGLGFVIVVSYQHATAVQRDAAARSR
mgnify:CR=1 FL=1